MGTRRRDHNRLGVATQLVTVRFLGTFLSDPADVPAGALRHVAEQLVAAGLVADVGEAARGLKLYRDADVRWDHQAEIRVRYGYRDFGEAGVQLGLLRWLYARAWVAAERPGVLFDLATARLVEAKVLLPGATVLARMVARVRERVATRLWSRLARMLDDDHRRRLDALLEVPDGARASLLEQLRRPPPALTARALAAAVERIRDLRALGVGGLDLAGLPPARIAALARHAATARAGDLTQLAPERRAATLIAFAHVGETRAVDDALEMFYELLRGLTARVQRRGQAERLGTLASLDAAASALRDAVAVLLDPAVPDDQVRASVFRRVEREALAAAVADCERLVRPPDDNFEAEPLSRYAMVRQFLPSLLATIEFKASPAGQPALEAVAALRALEGRKKVGFAEVPTETLTPAWRRLAGQPGGPLDRRAYTFAVLERLRAALRARDVFVPCSPRWSDPRAKLLAGPAWEATRARVCRTLGLSAEPGAALPRLATELDEAYRRTAGRFAANTAVELESGKLKLSALDRLDEPESLVSLREHVSELLPRIDLPDLLAEVAAWTGFADEFTHVSEASARVDNLALSVCAVLVAEAANVGLEPLARPDVGALTRGRLSWVAQNYLRADTLVGANARLVDYHATLPLARSWGGGEVASADGLRFVVPVRTISAGPNPRYFGVGRGVTYFNYTSDQFSGFHAIVIPGTCATASTSSTASSSRRRACDPPR